jgi:hypothetical protein
MIPRRRAKFDPPKIIACLGGTPQLLLVQKLYGQRRGRFQRFSSSHRRQLKEQGMKDGEEDAAESGAAEE